MRMVFMLSPPHCRVAGSGDFVNKIEKEKKEDKDPKSKNRLVRRFNKLRLKGDSKGRGVIYIGHLPKGFEEAELRKFFEQFGKINKLRVSRSKKTGRTRGYAFLEFAK